MKQKLETITPFFTIQFDQEYQSDLSWCSSNRIVPALFLVPQFECTLMPSVSGVVEHGGMIQLDRIK